MNLLIGKVRLSTVTAESFNDILDKAASTETDRKRVEMWCSRYNFDLFSANQMKVFTVAVLTTLSSIHKGKTHLLWIYPLH